MLAQFSSIIPAPVKGCSKSVRIALRKRSALFRRLQADEFLCVVRDIRARSSLLGESMTPKRIGVWERRTICLARKRHFAACMPRQISWHSGVGLTAWKRGVPLIADYNAVFTALCLAYVVLTEQELMPLVDPEMWEEILGHVLVPNKPRLECSVYGLGANFPLRKVCWGMRAIN